MAQIAATKNHDDHAVNAAEQRLLESAVKCFAEKGYSGTSIREIVRRADVTAPVLYYYFKSKEDLFRTLIQNQFDGHCAQIDHIVATETGCRNRLKALVRYAFEAANESPDLVRVMLQFFFASNEHMSLDKSKLADERYNRYVEIMRQGIEAGEIQGPDPDLLATSFVSILDLNIMSKFLDADAPLDPARGEALVELFMKGAEV